MRPFYLALPDDGLRRRRREHAERWMAPQVLDRPRAATKLVVSLDGEADNQWERGVSLTTRNVQSWEPFQELCERHGVVPTYLLASEFVADDHARDLLAGGQSRGVAEIGAHLHPWTTPPFADAPGLRFNDRLHAFPSELAEDLLREKVATLTGQIRDSFGFLPTAFRAGRFGVDGRLAKCLADAGFAVDSSVTPSVSWSRRPGTSDAGHDFSRFPVTPFRIAGTGEPGLLGIPVTILQTYRIFDRFPGLLRAHRLAPVRAVRRAIGHRHLQAQLCGFACIRTTARRISRSCGGGRRRRALRWRS